MKRVTMNVYYEKSHYEMMTMKKVTMKQYTARPPTVTSSTVTVSVGRWSEKNIMEAGRDSSGRRTGMEAGRSGVENERFTVI
jgi:hypothetical protein